MITRFERTLPLFSVQGCNLQALTGAESRFYEYLGPDMEGNSQRDFELTCGSLENSLNQCEGQLKIYKLGGNCYFNIFGSFTPSVGKLREHHAPIAAFVEGGWDEINFYENYLTQGTQYKRLVSLSSLPERLSPLEVCSFPDFVLCLDRYKPLAAKNRVNTKRKLHFQGLFKAMRDLDSENAFNQAERILEQVVTEGAGLFKAETYLLLTGANKESLDDETEYWMAHFRAKDAILRVEERGLPFLYGSLFPGVPASYKRALDVPSDYVAYMIPFHRDVIHEAGMSLTSRMGSSTRLDIFHPASLSFNVLITGTTGQGKSMLANKLLTHHLSEGAKAVVLDLGNSFLKNAKLHSARVLSQKINPMQFRNPTFLKEFILAVVDEKLGRKNEGKLYSCIRDYLSTNTSGTFQELIQHLDMEFSGLSFYFSELSEYFTDEESEVNEFTYCDFGHYPETMKAPMIIFLIEIFKSLQGRKVFIFDECWHLLEKNAAYVEECFRTFRKHNASAIAISQTLDDFAETRIGRVIINTSYTKFMFKQDLRISEFIDENTKTILDSIRSVKGQYSEFLYKSEVALKPLRYYPTPFEYELFTTDPKDVRQFDEYMRTQGVFLDFKLALENFTNIKSGKGAIA